VFHLEEVGKLNNLALELTPRRLARASELRIARASALLWRSSWLALVGRGLPMTVRRSQSKTVWRSMSRPLRWASWANLYLAPLKASYF
jgi:hypothetical protein